MSIIVQKGHERFVLFPFSNNKIRCGGGGENLQEETKYFRLKYSDRNF